MWYNMQILNQMIKIIIVLLLITFYCKANVIRDGIEVNFYTLAAKDKLLKDKKIAIRGWIRFYKYKESVQVYLFPSKASRDVYNIDEAIEIEHEKFDKARAYLNYKLVTVYGTYNVKIGSMLFGTINNITDINIDYRGNK